ncbi:MAG: lipopolysaccharide kinase InaA family protein [Porticoccus sp.]|jgi:tRNA A-37 threonylcarbamoyl transferase component Bud32|uniref:lipopolysaccharide kinase InaA family protein n=1 Tax=Porticoccus sp. TaxID=2024853 RepID=UPI00329862E7
MINTLSKDAQTDSDFDYWWEMEGPWVEEPNHRRGGISGVQRCRINGAIYYIKKQTDHTCRSLRHPLGYATIARETHRLDVCHKLGIATPEVVFSQTRLHQGTIQAILATRELAGFSSVEAWQKSVTDDFVKKETLNALSRKLGEILSRLHNSRWQHGCLYDKHIFFRHERKGSNEIEVALIDLEKCRRRFSISRASRHDIRQMRRHMPAMTEHHWDIFNSTYRQFSYLSPNKGVPWLSSPSNFK